MSDAQPPQDAPTPPARRRPRRAVRPGTERESIDGASSDERGDGWGETATDPGDSNEDRLRRDVPPHW